MRDASTLAVLTGDSDPNRLRYVPPLIGAEVLNRLAETRGMEA